MSQKRKGRGSDAQGRGGGGRGRGSGGPKRQKKGPAHQLQDVPLPPDEEHAADAGFDDISDEDVEFVQRQGGRVGFLAELNKEELDRSLSKKQRDQAQAQLSRSKQAALGDDEAGGKSKGRGRGGSDTDEDEQVYEKAPRSQAQEDKGGPKSRGLPVKTPDGDIIFDRATAATAAGPMKFQVAGVTVHDELDAAAAQDMAPTSKQQATDAASKKKGRAGGEEVEAEEDESEDEESEDEASELSEEEDEQEGRKRKQRRHGAADGDAEHVLPAGLHQQLRQYEDRAARREQCQEAIAVAGSKMLAGPESSVGELKILLALARDGDAFVARLAMLSLLAVFKDVIPGYRIRPPTEAELSMKISKEVQRTREYEAALLKSYQAYLKLLLDAAQSGGGAGKGRGRDGSSIQHARVAVRCMAGLLMALPHFNYTTDLLQALIPRMASGDATIRTLACNALKTVLDAADTTGAVGLEAVQLVADLVKHRKCVAPPQVVSSLLGLRFSEVKRPLEDGKKVKRGGKAVSKKERKAKADEVAAAFREASAAPDAKQLEAVQSAMLEALFEVFFRVLKHVTRAGLATLARASSSGANGSGGGIANTDKAAGHVGGVVNGGAAVTNGGGVMAAAAVGGSKDEGGGGVQVVWTRAQVQRRFPLLHPVLQGLSKYTHLISVDYFNDLMDVFRQLLRSPALPLQERLQVLLTASDILKGQGEALNIDRRDFHALLYEALLQVPLQGLLEPPLGASQPADASPSGNDMSVDEEDGDIAFVLAAGSINDYAPPSANSHTASSNPTNGASTKDGRAAPAASGAAAEMPLSVLLATVCSQMLADPKISDMGRLAAFLKRMLGVAMQSGPGEAMGLLTVVVRLLRRYPRLSRMLEYEGEVPLGGKVYDASCTDPGEAGALASTLWEVAVGASHYHPHVAQACSSLLALAPGQPTTVQLTGPLATASPPQELAQRYDTSFGSFHPAPKSPAPRKQQMSAPRRMAAAVAAAAAAVKLEAKLGGGGAVVGRAAPAAAGATANGGDGDGIGAGTARSSGGEQAAAVDEVEREAAAALKRLYMVSRRYHLNADLRREKDLLVTQLKRFSIHLAQQQQEEAAARRQARAEAQAGAAQRKLVGSKALIVADAAMTISAGKTHKERAKTVVSKPLAGGDGSANFDRKRVPARR